MRTCQHCEQWTGPRKASYVNRPFECRRHPLVYALDTAPALIKKMPGDSCDGFEETSPNFSRHPNEQQIVSSSSNAKPAREMGTNTWSPLLSCPLSAYKLRAAFSAKDWDEYSNTKS